MISSYFFYSNIIFRKDDLYFVFVKDDFKYSFYFLFFKSLQQLFFLQFDNKLLYYNLMIKFLKKNVDDFFWKINMLVKSGKNLIFRKKGKNSKSA